MKENMGLVLFQFIVNISTVIALILQCITLPSPWNTYTPYIAYIVIFFSALGAILSLKARKKYTLNRPKLIELTKNKMLNSSGKIVMFGGDLSWAEDYIEIIDKITSDSRIVEIIFPLEKILNSKSDAIDLFEKRTKKLINAGALVYSTDIDCHLRCTLIGVEPGKGNEDMCIISSKRIATDKSNSNKNKYHTILLFNKKNEDHTLCNSFYLNYDLIQKTYTQYKGEHK